MAANVCALNNLIPADFEEPQSTVELKLQPIQILIKW